MKTVMPDNTRLYISSLRLERWPRSLAIIPGAAAALVLYQESLAGIIGSLQIPGLILAFFLTWLISSANYIVNEITDAPFDAFHPAKKNRPLVDGRISRLPLALLGLFFIALALALALACFKRELVLSLLALFLAGLAYNVPPVRIKDLPYLDSTLESANNPIRFMIGWYVIAADFPPLSLLVSWWAFGNFLMIGKRVAEKKFLTDSESAGYRKSLIRSTVSGLLFFMIANSVLFLATFTVFALQAGLITILYALPFVIAYLAFFIWKSIQDQETAEEPEKLFKNPFFAFYTVFLAVLFLVAFLLR